MLLVVPEGREVILLVYIRTRLGKGDGFGLGTAAVVDDDALRIVPFEHLDPVGEPGVDGDEGVLSAALRGPVDDQFVGRQARQGAPDRLEVVTAPAGRGDGVDELPEAHLVVGDLRPLRAQQRENGRQDQPPRATQPQRGGMRSHACGDGRGVVERDPLARRALGRPHR